MTTDPATGETGSTTDKQQHEIVYTGRRLNAEGKALHAWLLDERGLYYTKLKGKSVGGIYTVDADVNDGTVSVYPGSLKYTGQKITDTDRIATWQAADQAARDSVAEAAAERRHAKSAELDAALEPLLRIARSTRTAAGLRALVQVVSNKITEAWWKRGDGTGS